MSGPDDPRPLIRETGPLYNRVDALEKLVDEHDPNIFARAHELIVIVGADASHVAAMRARGIEVPSGTPVIAQLSPPALNDRISRRTLYKRLFPSKKKGADPEWRECAPSKDAMASLFARKEWRQVRPIVAITETPVLHLDDGTIQPEGYDPKTGYLICPSAPLPPLPEEPTEDDARRALVALRMPFAEFPYQDDNDRDVPLAMALSILFRPSLAAIANVPAFLFRAPQKNCGKSLACKAAGILGEGRIPASCTWSEEHEEQEKVVGAAADVGLRVLFFDNVPDEVRVGGAAIDKRLTCSGKDSFRVLGLSQLKILDWRTIVAFTCKRAKMSGDADRRFVVCAMQRPDEKPAAYKIPDLETHILEHRPALLAAAYTLARAWIHAKRPSRVRRVDSFEPWSQTIAAMIRWAGGGDVTACIHDGHDGSDSDDDDVQNEETFLGCLHGFIDNIGATDGVTLRDDVMSAVFPDSKRDHGEPPEWKRPGFAWRDLADAIAALRIKGDRDGKPDARALGDKLRGMKNVQQGPYRLVAGPKNHGAIRWNVQVRGEGPRANGAAETRIYAPPHEPGWSGESGESGESAPLPTREEVFLDMELKWVGE